MIEDAFVDAWCDLLISGAWMDRDDPTLRECNWAIVRLLLSYRICPSSQS